MRATVIAIIVILVSAGLVGLAIVYTSMARGPLIRIRVLDEEGRPIEGALVQAFAIACPGSSTPAVEVLREKTGVGFDHSAPISRGKFVYIYTWAQVRYEEYQLYARPHPDVLVPLDVWWFETYVIDYELRDYDGDGVLDDIADGVEEVEELPDILSELGDGIAYELYNEYTGYGKPELKWAYMVSGKEIEDKYIPSEASGEYGLSISLGVVLASAIAHGELSGGLALPPSLMAVLTASWSVSGHADLGWCVFFDAPQGTEFRFYVGTTRLAFVHGHLEFKVPVLGIRWASA